MTELIYIRPALAEINAVKLDLLLHENEIKPGDIESKRIYESLEDSDVAKTTAF